jgi:hypothetical protein
MVNLLSEKIPWDELAGLVGHDPIESVEDCVHVLTVAVPQVFKDHGFNELPFPKEFVEDLRDQDVQTWFDNLSPLPTLHEFSEDWRMAYGWIVADYVEMNREFLRKAIKDPSAGFPIRKWLSVAKVDGAHTALLLLMGFHARVIQRRHETRKQDRPRLARRLTDADDWLAEYDAFLEELHSVTPNSPSWNSFVGAPPITPPSNIYADEPVAALKSHLGHLSAHKYPDVLRSLEFIRIELQRTLERYHEDYLSLKKADGGGGGTAPQVYVVCSFVAEQMAEVRSRKRVDVKDAMRYMSLWGVSISHQAFSKWRKRRAQRAKESAQ